MPQMPNGQFLPPQAMGGASSPVPPPSMPNVPQPQQAQLNPAAAAGAGTGGAATAEGVAQSMPTDAAAQPPTPGQPQAPMSPGVPTQTPMSMGWQPNQQGLLLYGSGQGPITSQVPDQSQMTPEGPAATPDAGEMDMMKLSANGFGGSPRRRGGLLVDKAAVDALAQISLQRAAQQTADPGEDDEEEQRPQPAAAPAGFSALNNKLAMRVQRGYSETKTPSGSKVSQWEPGHRFQGSQTKKIKQSGDLLNVQLQKKARPGTASRTINDLGKAAGQCRAGQEAGGSATTKSSMNRSAVGESGLTAKEKPWSLQGSDAWPSQDEMWSGAKKWNASLPAGKKQPMKAANLRNINLQNIDQQALTELAGTGGGAGLGAYVGGLSGLGAALGAGVGGISGLVDPGETEEGKERSRFLQMLKRMGIGGLGGAVGGAGLATLPLLGGGAGGVGGGLLGHQLSKQSAVICTKENCDQCGASMEAGDNNTCNRCGAKNSYGQKEARLSESARGFLDRCTELGLNDLEILHAVKEASALSPEIANDLSPLLEKQALGGILRGIGGLLGGGARAGAGSMARGMGRAMPRRLPAPRSAPRLPAPKPTATPRLPAPRAAAGGAGGAARPPVGGMGGAMGGGGRPGAGVTLNATARPAAGGAGGMGGGMGGGAAGGAMGGGQPWYQRAGNWFARGQGPVAQGTRQAVGWGAGGAALGGSMDMMTNPETGQTSFNPLNWDFSAPFQEGSRARQLGGMGLMGGGLYGGGRGIAQKLFPQWVGPAAAYSGLAKPLANAGGFAAMGAAGGAGQNLAEHVFGTPFGNQMMTSLENFAAENNLTVNDFIGPNGDIMIPPQLVSRLTSQQFMDLANQYPELHAAATEAGIFNPETGEVDFQRGMEMAVSGATMMKDVEALKAAASPQEQMAALQNLATKYGIELPEQLQQLEAFSQSPLGGLLAGFMDMSPGQQMLLAGGAIMAIMGLGSMLGGGGGMGAGLGLGGLLLGGLGMYGPQLGLFGGGEPQEAAGGPPGQQGQPGPGGGQMPQGGPSGPSGVPPSTEGMPDPGELPDPKAPVTLQDPGGLEGSVLR